MAPGRFAGHKVLVTGAGGFLGSHLVGALRRSGADVSAVFRRAVPSDLPGVHCVRGDLGDAATARELVASTKPDVIFSLTSSGAGAPDLELVLPTLRSDLVATVNVLTAATQLACRRIVLAASSEEPAPGAADLVPSSPYAAAKAASSAYARMFYALYRCPVVITRPAMAYGPGQRDHKVIPYVILSFLRGQPPRLGSGRRLLDWVYIDDVIAGLLAAADAPDVEGCTMDLGSGTLVPVRTIVEQLAHLVGCEAEPVFGALPDRPRETVRAADTSTAFVKLGWRAETCLERGLASTVDWYRRRQRDLRAAGGPSDERSARAVGADR